MTSTPAPAGETSEFVRETLAHADELARSYDDPKAIVRNLAEWVRNRFPERVASAYWIQVNGSVDKGFNVRLYEKPMDFLGGLKLRLGALFGKETAGVSVTIPFRTTEGWEVGIGVGAVVDYETFKDVSAVATLTIRF